MNCQYFLHNRTIGPVFHKQRKMISGKSNSKIFEISNVDSQLDISTQKVAKEYLLKSEIHLKEALSMVRSGYTSLVSSSLEKHRNCLAKAASLIFENDKNKEYGKKIQELFNEKIDISNKEAEKIFNELCLVSSTDLALSYLKFESRLAGSKDIYDQGPIHHKVTVDFEELISKFRKPKDVEDAQFLLLFNLNRASKNYHTDEILAYFFLYLFEMSQVKTSVTDKKILSNQQLAIEQNEKFISSHVKKIYYNTLKSDLKDHQQTYNEHILCTNKLWRDLQRNIQIEEVKDLKEIEDRKQGIDGCLPVIEDALKKSSLSQDVFDE